MLRGDAHLLCTCLVCQVMLHMSCKNLGGLVILLVASDIDTESGASCLDWITSDGGQV